MAFPPVITDKGLGDTRPAGVFRETEDPAKYIVQRRRFERPSLFVPPKGPNFEWPVGVEGMGISGQPGLATHNYLGDNAAVVQIIHRDTRRFQMTGILPGHTGSENMRDLIEVVTAIPPKGFWLLRLPALILTKEQQVVIENYDFQHAEDDGTDSWVYTISFLLTGVGQKNDKPGTTKPPSNPIGSTKKPPKGKSTRIFTTKNGANTLRAVAKLVYGNPNRWQEIYNKNKKLLSSLNVPLLQLQYKRLPYGMKLHY